MHRVDGPIGVYRGFDDGTDARIASMNAELAHATVCQSRFSLDAHRRLGIALADPVVITNAPDPAIFHPPSTREPLDGRPLRVVATSWSDNPRKGADVLRALGAAVDPATVRADLRRAPAERARRLDAGRPSRLAGSSQSSCEARTATSRASIDDPCSNALLEALACGLPALFRRSGGHPELVGDGGVGFDGPEDAPRRARPPRRGARRAPRGDRRPVALGDVADRYLEVLRG